HEKIREILSFDEDESIGEAPKKSPTELVKVETPKKSSKKSNKYVGSPEIVSSDEDEDEHEPIEEVPKKSSTKSNKHERSPEILSSDEDEPMEEVST
ncbi:unnamed protein product, partial [Rotaria magnacalcarata]